MMNNGSPMKKLATNEMNVTNQFPRPHRMKRALSATDADMAIFVLTYSGPTPMFFSSALYAIAYRNNDRCGTQWRTLLIDLSGDQDDNCPPFFVVYPPSALPKVVSTVVPPGQDTSHATRPLAATDA